MLLKKKLFAIIIATIPGILSAGYDTWPATPDNPVKDFENLPQAQIKKFNGVGSLFINGKIYPRIGLGATGTTSIREKADTGINLVQSPPLSIGSKAQMDSFRKNVDYTIQKILEALPDAMIIIRFPIEPSPEFLKENPGSCVTGENGENIFQDRFNRYFSEYVKQRPSWASMKWRKLADEEIRQAIEYIVSRPYAGHIAGIYFSAGHTGEFDQWFGGEKWSGGVFGDWCQESVERFREWLRREYGDDQSRLQKAWNDPQVTFATAAIPSWKDNKRDPVTFFRYSSKRRSDYERFFQEQIGETIESWCRSAKIASGNRLIAGATTAVGDSGSRMLLNSPWIDFGGGPAGYNNRQPGGNSRHDFIGEEMRRYGKWFFDELDFRTMYYDAEHYGVPDMATTLSVLKREHALITVEGCGGYWYEFRNSTYRHPKIWRLFKQQSEISELAAMYNRDNPVEVAYVTANDTEFCDLRLNVLDRMGAPYHALRLETLLAADTIPYKLIIFDLPSVNNEMRILIQRKLQNNNRWMVFLRPVGAINPDLSEIPELKNSSDIHGICLVPSTRHSNSELISTVDCKLIPGLAGLKKIQPDRNINGTKKAAYMREPTRMTAQAQVTDSSAIPLAVWPDKTIAAALKQYRDWTSVYIPTNDLSSEFIRILAKASGIHQYETEFDDVIYGNGQFLCFHTRRQGIRKIILKEPGDLYDLYERCFIGKGQKEYTVPMEAFDTRFFFIGDPTENLKKIEEMIDRENLQRSDLYDKVKRENAQIPPPDLRSGFQINPVGVIGDWLFLGPVLTQNIKSSESEADFELKVLREPAIKEEPDRLNPTPYGKESTIAGDILVWSPLPYGLSQYYAVNYYENFARNAVFYIAVWMSSKNGGKYTLSLRTERGNQVWLDGKKLGESFYLQKKNIWDFPVNLNPGKKHQLLIKIWSAGGGNTGWCAKLFGTDNKPATDVSLWFYGK